MGEKLQPFDVLSKDCPLFGPHLLEASAGTGKTFSIEHVVVRLLLQSEVELEQILAVTFTKAATRDLKKRIRSNIQEALFRIRNQKPGWEYLEPHFGREHAAKKLEFAELNFDRCQIFTIHGFCQRMLTEFSFEAGLGFSKSLEETNVKRLYIHAKKFIEEGIPPGLICPEQMAILLKEYDTIEKLASALLDKKGTPSPPFATMVDRYQAQHPTPKDLLDTFHKIKSDYKVCKADFESQIQALSLDDPKKALQILIQEKGSLFTLLSSKNRKVKPKHPPDPFFEWAQSNIYPLIQEAAHPKNILGALQTEWEKIEEPILKEENCFSPDEILKQMQKGVKIPSFANAVRQKYKAVIVDEFQDTDPLQWEIFKTLFLSKPLVALYLVGDPKQSIYRFRKADIYTYFEARELLGPSAHYSLNTNYRSTPGMITILNALFHRSWLHLPKLNKTLPTYAVKPHVEKDFDFEDGKGAVHFFSAPSFEESALPFAIQEIERLIPKFSTLSSFAILVKDRYQGEMARGLCQERGIHAICRSHIPLGKTLAMQAVCEFFNALHEPRNHSLKRMVQAGPFAKIPLCLENGLIFLCRQMLQIDLEDLKQVIEEILIWEGREGFSMHGLLRFLENLKNLEADEGGERRIEIEEDAVQILTLHASKGLEFEVIFALGPATKPPQEDEEEEADSEKLRLLYVALTRAKKRLYIPISAKEKSPMANFLEILKKEEGDPIAFLGKHDSFSFEELASKIDLGPPKFKPKQAKAKTLQEKTPKFTPSFLHSFTTLARPKSVQHEPISSAEFTPHTIPKGIETGILIHEIMERIFSQTTAVWQSLPSITTIVSKHLQERALEPWTSAIIDMIWKTLNIKIGGEFSLSELEVGNVLPEMEFLYKKEPNYITGFIDLVFLKNNKFYLVDWKTNWLGPDDSYYLDLKRAMEDHDYFIQAKLYTEALSRHVKRLYTESFDEIFGGAIYFFLRGGGICQF